MENIKLSNILQLCMEFKTNPEDSNKYKEVQNLINKLEVKEYMPLSKKELAVICIIGCAPENMDAADSVINILAGKIFYGLLPYAINLEIDVEYGLITPGIIDCLYELGVVDYISQFCEEDYLRICEMVSEAINFSNIEKIMKIPSLLSEEKLEEVTNAINNFKSDLTPEVLESIKAISTETSPEWKALKETVAEEVYKNVMKKTMEPLEK